LKFCHGLLELSNDDERKVCVRKLVDSGGAGQSGSVSLPAQCKLFVLRDASLVPLHYGSARGGQQ
jgi:hypothetical protein